MKEKMREAKEEVETEQLNKLDISSGNPYRIGTIGYSTILTCCSLYCACYCSCSLLPYLQRKLSIVVYIFGASRSFSEGASKAVCEGVAPLAIL